MMKLTLEITDEQLDSLRQTLKISLAEYKRLLADPKDPSPELKQARLILKCRMDLNLPNCAKDACYDFNYDAGPQ